MALRKHRRPRCCVKMSKPVSTGCCPLPPPPTGQSDLNCFLNVQNLKRATTVKKWTHFTCKLGLDLFATFGSWLGVSCTRTAKLLTCFECQSNCVWPPSSGIVMNDDALRQKWPKLLARIGWVYSYIPIPTCPNSPPSWLAGQNQIQLKRNCKRLCDPLRYSAARF